VAVRVEKLSAVRPQPPAKGICRAPSPIRTFLPYITDVSPTVSSTNHPRLLGSLKAPAIVSPVDICQTHPRTPKHQIPEHDSTNHLNTRTPNTRTPEHLNTKHLNTKHLNTKHQTPNTLTPSLTSPGSAPPGTPAFPLREATRRAPSRRT